MGFSGPVASLRLGGHEPAPDAGRGVGWGGTGGLCVASARPTLATCRLKPGSQIWSQQSPLSAQPSAGGSQAPRPSFLAGKPSLGCLMPKSPAEGNQSLLLPPAIPRIWPCRVRPGQELSQGPRAAQMPPGPLLSGCFPMVTGANEGEN